MPAPNDPGRCTTALAAETTLIAVVEMSQSSWLVAAMVPGVERHPLKKLEADEAALLKLLERWRGEAARAGRSITRIAVAFGEHANPWGGAGRRVAAPVVSWPVGAEGAGGWCRNW